MKKYINFQEFQEVISNNDKLIVIFALTGTCKVGESIARKTEELIDKEYPFVDIYYINVDEEEIFRGQYLIYAPPTLIFFDHQKEILRESKTIRFNNIERLLEIYKDNLD